MIRKVKQEDAAAIAAIYNDHVKHTCVTFEDEEVSVAEMQKRISEISSHYPYLVYEAENGEIAGYCYAHGWKEKQAYRLTAETTIYIAPAFQRQGIGKALMNELIVKCREAGLHVLIACITYPNPAVRNYMWDWDSNKFPVSMKSAINSGNGWIFMTLNCGYRAFICR